MHITWSEIKIKLLKYLPTLSQHEIFYDHITTTDPSQKEMIILGMTKKISKSGKFNIV